MDLTYTGIGAQQRAAILERGRDDAGHPVEPFTDDEGGWLLRCCLRDSIPGDRLVIIAFSPFPWVSAYRETGPIVIHAENCPGAAAGYPAQFDQRDQVVRAFGDDAGRHHTQVYDLNRLVRAGEGLHAVLAETLGDDRVEFVHVHNVLSQCYNFAATRSVTTPPLIADTPF
jgi:hypothetical protein